MAASVVPSGPLLSFLARKSSGGKKILSEKLLAENISGGIVFSSDKKQFLAVGRCQLAGGSLQVAVGRW